MIIIIIIIIIKRSWNRPPPTKGDRWGRGRDVGIHGMGRGKGMFEVVLLMGWIGSKERHSVRVYPRLLTFPFFFLYFFFFLTHLCFLDPRGLSLWVEKALVTLTTLSISLAESQRSRSGSLSGETKPPRPREYLQIMMTKSFFFFCWFKNQNKNSFGPFIYSFVL